MNVPRLYNLSSLIDRCIRLANQNAPGHPCKRKSVCCSAVDLSGPDIFDFYNGPTTSEVPCSGERGNCGCCHAEPRAILFILRAYPGRKGFSLVVNYSPCSSCANLIVSSKVIDKVIYRVDTEHDMRGLDILRGGGIEVVQA